MNIQKVLNECEGSLGRLSSIAQAAGISDKPLPSPVITPAARELAGALILCPDDSAADRALRRFATGWPSFLFLAHMVESQLKNGGSYDIPIEKGDCPFFHIATFVSSFIEHLITWRPDDSE